MEVATLIGLAGLGWLVTTTTDTKSKKPVAKPTREGFQGTQPAAATRAPYKYPVPAPAPIAKRGSPTQMDQMFQNTLGQTFPSEPNPATASGLLPTDYNREAPTARPRVEGVAAVTPSVAMNPSGLEENPTYIDGDTMVSPLSGVSMSTSEFVHNNMQPFFGGRVKQNVNVEANSSLLDSFTGAGGTQINKREVESMFESSKTPFGNPFGLEDSTDFIQSRLDDPRLRRRDGEKPFDEIKVAPGIGEKFGSTGKGGFQQMEVNEYMMKNMRRTDDLRTSDNPKLTYNTPVVPGQHFTGKAAENPGEVRHYRPDTFTVNQEAERFIGAFSESSQRETVRSVQVMPYQTRSDTSTEVFGPAASQEMGDSYVVGAYGTPKVNQHGGAGFRNADMEGYYTKDTDTGDYGAKSYEVRPNERYYTSERTMGLNVTPADAQATTVHYNDPSRPTRREETSGNIRQAGTATLYEGGAPAVTVWDPSDVARTTVKETTIKWDYRGIASPADGPTRLKVYDPEDIARPTQKAQISAKSEYFGGGKAATEKFTSHQAAYNMRKNPNRTSKLAKPMAGNGGNIGLFNTNVNQTYKKLDVDILNDRALAVNNVTGLPPGAGDIGQVKYRAPLKMDVSTERNSRDMISAVESNPLQQSIQRSAEHDEALLQEYLRGSAF